jgi:hypothetical protein
MLVLGGAPSARALSPCARDLAEPPPCHASCSPNLVRPRAACVCMRAGGRLRQLGAGTLMLRRENNAQWPGGLLLLSHLSAITVRRQERENMWLCYHALDFSSQQSNAIPVDRPLCHVSCCHDTQLLVSGHPCIERACWVHACSLVFFEMFS